MTLWYVTVIQIIIRSTSYHANNIQVHLDAVTRLLACSVRLAKDLLVNITAHARLCLDGT